MQMLLSLDKDDSNNTEKKIGKRVVFLETKKGILQLIRLLSLRVH